MQEIWVFANPIAGKGKGRGIAEGIASRLRKEGFGAKVFLDRADKLDSEGMGNVKAVVVIGGDGTLREVADRILKECGGREMPPLLVVPMGTANLMGRHLGIAWHAKAMEREVVEAIKNGRVVKLDAARANGHLFLLMAGIGIDGKVVHELERIRRGPISMASYALPMAMAIGKYRYPALEVEVDGKRVFEGRPAIAMVGNVAEYAMGLVVLPEAKADDGLLDVCVMPCGSTAELVKLFLHAAAGEHTKMEGVVYVRGKKVTVKGEEKAPVQVDGDGAGFTPVEIELLPVRIPFIVPAS